MSIYKVVEWNEGHEDGDGFDAAYAELARMFLSDAPKVDTGHWQSLKDVPHTATRELQSVHLSMIDPPSSVDGLKDYFKPNLPWAEDHFAERVGGQPLNPGEEYKNWPWYRGGVEDHKESGAFSHTYMERFWPRFAGALSGQTVHDITTRGGRQGIRYRYGDLDDLIDLLTREPHTRQAYLPIWFPEDLAAAAKHEERVPCTLGYHFMLRDNKLHLFYPIRSMDFVRYMRDDLYMAARLALVVLNRCTILWDLNNDDSLVDGGTNPWLNAKLGDINLFVASLHIFEGDVPKLEREHG